jgi:hypothetical protein
MKKEYDFSNAERGKFYKENMELNIPLYLDPDIKEYFEKLAIKNKTDVGVIVNKILKKSIQFSKNLNL